MPDALAVAQYSAWAGLGGSTDRQEDAARISAVDSRGHAESCAALPLAFRGGMYGCLSPLANRKAGHAQTGVRPTMGELSEIPAADLSGSVPNSE